jgi:hypothetical protein
MSKEYKLFDPKSLASNKIVELNLIDVEINKENMIGEEGKDSYVVDFSFKNIFYKDEFNDTVEQYFDKIYHTVLEESGIYLENIELVDNEEIYAWGTIFKENDEYYVTKPDNTE